MGGKSRKAGQVSRKLIERLKQGTAPKKESPKKQDLPSLLPRDSK